MQDPEQIEKMLALLEECGPGELLRKMNETSTGIAAVLRFLRGAEGAVTAGQISRFMNVSTARMAVLLRKMETKGLITRRTGAADGRTTVVALSALGREKAETMHREMCRQVEKLMEKIGPERMEEYAAITSEIRAVVRPPLEWLDKKQT